MRVVVNQKVRVVPRLAAPPRAAHEAHVPTAAALDAVGRAALAALLPRHRLLHDPHHLVRLGIGHLRRCRGDAGETHHAAEAPAAVYRLLQLLVVLEAECEVAPVHRLGGGFGFGFGFTEPTADELRGRGCERGWGAEECGRL